MNHYPTQAYPMASANQLPPTLPAHEVPMSPSPTPTVNPQFLSHEDNEKYGKEK